jgi:hypothetical protein
MLTRWHPSVATQHANLLCMLCSCCSGGCVALLSGLFNMLAHCNHLDTRGDSLQLVLGHVHKLTRPLVGSSIAQQVQRCQPRLPPAVMRGNDTESWPLWQATVTSAMHIPQHGAWLRVPGSPLTSLAQQFRVSDVSSNIMQQTRRSAPADEDQHRLDWGVRLDGGICWLIHGGHARTVELARVTLQQT